MRSKLAISDTAGLVDVQALGSSHDMAPFPCMQPYGCTAMNTLVTAMSNSDLSDQMHKKPAAATGKAISYCASMYEVGVVTCERKLIRPKSN